MAAHQAPPSLGFSRQEHWSGLPFPSPMHENGKWKVKSESEIAQLCPTLSDPMDCNLPGFSVHGIFQARVLEWGAIAFSIHMHIANVIYCIQSTLYMYIAYSLYTHIDYTLYMHIIAILCIWQGSDLFHTLTTQYDMKFKVHETLKRKINMSTVHLGNSRDISKMF